MNRSAIKSQAKQLIHGKVFSLFIISFVINLVVSSIALSTTIPSIYQLIKSTFETVAYSSYSSSFVSLINLLLTPLAVALMGYFVLFIRNQKNGELGEGVTYIFKNAFSKNYLNYLLVSVLKNIFIVLGTFLFIIPGIILSFSYFFAREIICDNPTMNAMDALRLSKKITKGYKTELFVLMLSFIGHALLVSITFGIYSIYFTPYYSTVKALYYENFKQRAIQTGVASREEFGYTAPQEVPVDVEQIIPEIIDNNEPKEF